MPLLFILIPVLLVLWLCWLWFCLPCVLCVCDPYVKWRRHNWSIYRLVLITNLKKKIVFPWNITFFFTSLFRYLSSIDFDHNWRLEEVLKNGKRSQLVRERCINMWEPVDVMIQLINIKKEEKKIRIRFRLKINLKSKEICYRKLK